MNVRVIINRSYLEGNSPKGLKVGTVQLNKEEINLQYIELEKAKEFLSSFTSDCRDHIFIEKDASTVYSIQIPLKYIDTVFFD